jgi:hypothetical protein
MAIAHEHLGYPTYRTPPTSQRNSSRDDRFGLRHPSLQNRKILGKIKEAFSLKRRIWQKLSIL